MDSISVAEEFYSLSIIYIYIHFTVMTAIIFLKVGLPFDPIL